MFFLLFILKNQTGSAIIGIVSEYFLAFPFNAGRVCLERGHDVMATPAKNLSAKMSRHDLLVDHFEGFRNDLTNYHAHQYYEISLIISGNVKVLLQDESLDDTECKIVLLRPHTPHLIAVDPDLFYRRVNVLFYHDFINDKIDEWQNLMNLFGENGRIIPITPEQCAKYQELIARMEADTNPFRRQLLLLYYLSQIEESLDNKTPKAVVPSYVIEAMTYINTNYPQKIVASDLAWDLHIGRTTLMTAFKKYTGTTLNEYIARCRLKNAILAMQQGKKEQQVAEDCGFTDLCNMIRCFKRYFNMTPKQYLASLNRSPDSHSSS